MECPIDKHVRKENTDARSKCRRCSELQRNTVRALEHKLKVAKQRIEELERDE